MNRWAPIGGWNGETMSSPQPAAPADVAARRAFCDKCDANIGDRCQHPRQGCAPCKQGGSLVEMLALAGFRCPKGNF